MSKAIEEMRDIVGKHLAMGLRARMEAQIGMVEGELREAADTIISLRDSLNEVADRWADAQIEAEVYARENMLLKVYNNTRWHELFGTPERAARTLANNCDEHNLCDGCPADCESYDCHDALLEWLRGDA